MRVSADEPQQDVSADHDPKYDEEVTLVPHGITLPIHIVVDGYPIGYGGIVHRDEKKDSHHHGVR